MATDDNSPGHSVRPAWQQHLDSDVLKQKAAATHTAWPFDSMFDHQGSKETSKVGNATKVEIAIYYEVMCPYCRNLMNSSVAELWNNTEFRKRIDVKFYPYGNAVYYNKEDVSDGYRYWHDELQEEGFDYVFSCQHDQEECFGNTMQSCAMEMLSKPKKYVPFVLCMEGYREDASIEMGSYDCATELDIDMDPIKECTLGATGNKLTFEVGQATETLNPPHEYVPWVTLNGEHSVASELDGEKNDHNLLREVCIRLSEPKPELCSSQVSSSKLRR